MIAPIAGLLTIRLYARSVDTNQLYQFNKYVCTRVARFMRMLKSYNLRIKHKTLELQGSPLS